MLLAQARLQLLRAAVEATVQRELPDMVRLGQRVVAAPLRPQLARRQVSAVHSS